jgi:hypothetical protein
MTRLYCVYDADGTLRGEIAYVVGHLLGRRECSMCDISHGPTGTKKAWTAFVAEQAVADVSVVTLHRDELPEDLRRFIDRRYPCVVSETEQGFGWVAGIDELRACAGDIAAFRALIAATGIGDA